LIKELKEIAPLVKEAKDQAQLGNSHLFDVLGLDEGSRAQRSGAVRRKLDQVTALSAVMFNSAERYNRQVTLLAIYKLEMAKLAESNPNMSLAERQQKAIDVSMHKTTEYNGGSHLETAPRLSQQHIGRIAFMYKSYGLRMYATMLNTAKIAIQRTYPGDSKEAIAARKEARQQLAGIHGTALFFSGMYGLPLYGAMEVFFNLFLQDEDEGEEDFNTVVRKAIGEGWFKGPLTEFTGLDIGSRMRLSGLLIQANRFNPDASPEETLVHHIGGPAWSVGSRIARGYDDISKGNVQRGVEQLLPAGLSNLYKGSFGRLMEDQAYATRRGDPIYDDLSAGELFGQTFGFAPTGYVLQQEINQRNKGIERVLNEKRTKLMKDYYIAIRFGNSGKARDVMLDIQEFNKRHPEYMLGPKSIVRSLKGHMRTSARMEGGVTINPKLRQAMQESNAEYERGFKFFRLEDDD